MLEDLCRDVLSVEADAIDVQEKDRYIEVSARRGNAAFGIANFKSSGSDAKQLRRNLYAAARKPVRAVLNGKLSILRVRIYDSFGADAFEVTIGRAPQRNATTMPSFTAKQGQYLAFIYHYSKIHRQAPAESDLQNYFRVSPPSVHERSKRSSATG